MQLGLHFNRGFFSLNVFGESVIEACEGNEKSFASTPPRLLPGEERAYLAVTVDFT